jgi:hypothetical protein
MKRSIALIGAVVMAAGTIAFAGCGDKGEEDKRVMNLSLNPEVEFLLDENNVVISANALNEEGNLILNADVFVGKSAEDAANLFVQISADTGFLVKGNVSVDDNEIEIAFSGDAKEAEKLFNNVKDKVKSSLQAANVKAEIELEDAISKEDLQKLAAECAPYLEAAEIQALEYKQLIETVYQSRKETADFYSQELKNAYYEAKAIAIEKAEIDTLKTKVSGIVAAGVDIAYNAYSTAVEKIEQVRMEQLVDADSAYQKGLATFREKKVEYLKFRNEIAAMEQSAVTDAMKATLENLDKAVEVAEDALVQLGVTANSLIDSAKTLAKTAYDSVVSALEAASVKISEHLDEVSKKQEAAQAALINDFKTEYAEAINQAKKSWADMQKNLQTPNEK